MAFPIHHHDARASPTSRNKNHRQWPERQPQVCQNGIRMPCLRRCRRVKTSGRLRGAAAAARSREILAGAAQAGCFLQTAYEGQRRGDGRSFTNAMPGEAVAWSRPVALHGGLCGAKVSHGRPRGMVGMALEGSLPGAQRHRLSEAACTSSKAAPAGLEGGFRIDANQAELHVGHRVIFGLPPRNRASWSGRVAPRVTFCGHSA